MILLDEHSSAARKWHKCVMCCLSDQMTCFNLRCDLSGAYEKLKQIWILKSIETHSPTGVGSKSNPRWVCLPFWAAIHGSTSSISLRLTSFFCYWIILFFEMKISLGSARHESLLMPDEFASCHRNQLSCFSTLNNLVANLLFFS